MSKGVGLELELWSIFVAILYIEQPYSRYLRQRYMEDVRKKRGFSGLWSSET